MKKLTSAIGLLFLVMNLSAQVRLGIKATSPMVAADQMYKAFFNKEAGKLYSLQVDTITTSSEGSYLYEGRMYYSYKLLKKELLRNPKTKETFKESQDIPVIGILSFSTAGTIVFGLNAISLLVGGRLFPVGGEDLFSIGISIGYLGSTALFTAVGFCDIKKSRSITIQKFNDFVLKE